MHVMQGLMFEEQTLSPYAFVPASSLPPGACLKQNTVYFLCLRLMRARTLTQGATSVGLLHSVVVSTVPEPRFHWGSGEGSMQRS